jgi:hypothetical protein
MSDRKWIKFDGLRQPGMRRILDAMKQIEVEAAGLLDAATTASIELTKRRDDGRIPQ